MNSIIHSVMGSWGFIGSEIVKNTDFHRNEPNPWDYRNKFLSDFPDIIYCISTNHNYLPLENDPYTDVQTNILHTISVLQANKIKYGSDFTFTFLSSWFVYGDVPLPAKEDTCCKPKGFYSITKLAAEQLIESYCKSFGIDYRIIRLCNVLGVGDTKVSKKKNALQYMVKTLCEGGEVDLYETKDYRDYLCVEDAAEAIRTIANLGEYNTIYNVGYGKATGIHELVILAHCNSGRGKVNLVPVPDFHKEVQVQEMYLDNTKLLSLGWKPTKTPEQVVTELCDYYKEING